MLTLNINLSDHAGPVYFGRTPSSLLREKLNLDQYDQCESVVTISIPHDAYVVTSSYFLGLFEKSVLAAGSSDKFLTKYKFKCRTDIYTEIQGYVVRALCQAQLLQYSNN